jgi:type VI protein secretion system component VasK
VHAFLSPAMTDRYIGDANAEYMTGLAELRSKFDQAALAQGDARTMAMNDALNQGINVKTAITKAAGSFSTARPAIPVGDDLRRILTQPVTFAEAVVRVAPTADVNSGGAAFCAPFSTLDRKFPFNSSATDNASIDEVSTALQRGSGALWNNETAQNLLVRQGPTWRAKPGAQPEPNPQFVNFYNRATRVSEALYNETGDGPSVAFGLRPQFSDGLDRVVVQVDSRRAEFTPSNPAEQVFVWNGPQAQTARISARVNGVDVNVPEAPNGSWALFRIMQEAQWEPAGGQFYNLRWRLPGQQATLTLVLRIPAGGPIFQKDYLRLNCTAQIAR